MQYGESNPQSNDRLVFDRIVAWSSLELYFLGLILWNTSLSGEIYIKRGIGTDASGRQTSVYDGVGYDRMDVVCRTGNGTGCLLHRNHVLCGWTWSGRLDRILLSEINTDSWNRCAPLQHATDLSAV